MAGAASWLFSENDFKQIQQHLQAFLREANARCALLVDRTAQPVATALAPPAPPFPRSGRPGHVPPRVPGPGNAPAGGMFGWKSFVEWKKVELPAPRFLCKT